MQATTKKSFDDIFKIEVPSGCSTDEHTRLDHLAKIIRSISKDKTSKPKRNPKEKKTPH